MKPPLNKESKMEPKWTKGDFGVSILDKEFPGGEPVERGAMIVTPPPKEAVQMAMEIGRGERRKGFTSRRIALLESSHYVSHAECVSNAYLFVAAKAMYAALTKIRRNDLPDSEQPLWDEIQAALKRARNEE